MRLVGWERGSSQAQGFYEAGIVLKQLYLMKPYSAVAVLLLDLLPTLCTPSTPSIIDIYYYILYLLRFAVVFAVLAALKSSSALGKGFGPNCHSWRWFVSGLRRPASVHPSLQSSHLSRL